MERFRVHSFVGNPLLGSPHSQRHVKWELDNVILSPLCITRKLLENCTVSNALADIGLVVENILDSLQTFLLGMDWNGHERDLWGENSSFICILEEISRIHGNENTRVLISLPLVEALVTTGKMRASSVYSVCDFLATNFTYSLAS